MLVVICIPAFNEQKDIARVIDDIKQVMKPASYKYKILVFDDGSADDTVGIAKKHGAIVYSSKVNLGLAKTFKKEMQTCLDLGADIIVHTDADGQYPARFIPKLIAEVEKGYDLVLGSRFGKGSYRGSLMKKMGNIAFAKVFSGLLKQKIKDTTTGFRAFNRTIAELPLNNRFTYTQEQLIRANKLGCSIKEVNIVTAKTRPSRLFKNPFEYAVKAWVNIIRIYRDFAPLKFFGAIGGFFLILGTVLGAWISYLWLTTGGVGGVPRVILSMLLIMTGVQIIIFGFLADMQQK